MIRNRLALLACALLLSGQAVAQAALPVPAPPSIDARAWVLMDHATGQVLAERNMHERMEPASITKIMTAYVVFHELRAGRLSMDDTVLISENAWRKQGSKMFVRVGNRVPVRDLLMGMIVQSGNDASIALAEHIAGSEETFAALMNQYAKQLGLKNTHFTNATGWPDENHYSSAWDIAQLTRALIREFPDYYRMYRERSFTWNHITQYNRNRLLARDPSVDGVKTGHTESAGYCLVSSAERDGQRLIAVVLGTADEDARADYSLALLNYGFRFFETVPLYAAGEEASRVRVWKGASDEVALGVPEDLLVTIPRGARSELNLLPIVDGLVIAPVDKGQVIGTLEVRHMDRLLRSTPLVALEAVPEGSLLQRLIDEIRLRMQ